MVIVIICLAIAFVTFGVYILTGMKKPARPGGFSPKRENFATCGQVDYRNYDMTSAERMKYISAAAVVLLGIGYVSFRNVFMCMALCSLSFLYPALKKKGLIRKRKLMLNTQFRDALHSISSSLSAGRSVEGSFREALDDLILMYPDENAFIIKEFEAINRKLEMNETIESALLDFARRGDSEDISNFADVFVICKSTGGNLVEAIKNTAGVINQKIDIKNEIEVLVAEQKLSQKILNAMPFILLVLIMTSSPDYVMPLYNPKGHLVMLLVLGLLALAYFIGVKIMDIEV